MTKVLIVEARFYEDLADELVKGATTYLDGAQVEYDRLSVPGAFEIPAAIAFAQRASGTGGPAYAGYIALGCVIRGETTHYDYVCGESARGLQDLAVRDGLAIGYGILTVENDDQAWVRASVDKKNKGRDAAEACLAMIAIQKRFGLA
jgi:6,7-dimethyl-8-ribityllumazine synthase